MRCSCCRVRDGFGPLDRRRSPPRTYERPRFRSPRRNYGQRFDERDSRRAAAEAWQPYSYPAEPREWAPAPPPGVAASRHHETPRHATMHQQHWPQGHREAYGEERRDGSYRSRPDDVRRRQEHDVRWGMELADDAAPISAPQPGWQHSSGDGGMRAELVPPAVDFEAKARDVGYRFLARHRYGPARVYSHLLLVSACHRSHHLLASVVLCFATTQLFNTLRVCASLFGASPASAHSTPFGYAGSSTEHLAGCSPQLCSPQ